MWGSFKVLLLPPPLAQLQRGGGGTQERLISFQGVSWIFDHPPPLAWFFKFSDSSVLVFFFLIYFCFVQNLGLSSARKNGIEQAYTILDGIFYFLFYFTFLFLFMFREYLRSLWQKIWGAHEGGLWVIMCKCNLAQDWTEAEITYLRTLDSI